MQCKFIRTNYFSISPFNQGWSWWWLWCSVFAGRQFSLYCSWRPLTFTTLKRQTTILGLYSRYSLMFWPIATGTRSEILEIPAKSLTFVTFEIARRVALIIILKVGSFKFVKRPWLMSFGLGHVKHFFFPSEKGHLDVITSRFIISWQKAILTNCSHGSLYHKVKKLLYFQLRQPHLVRLSLGQFPEGLLPLDAGMYAIWWSHPSRTSRSSIRIDDNEVQYKIKGKSGWKTPKAK